MQKQVYLRDPREVPGNTIGNVIRYTVQDEKDIGRGINRARPIHKADNLPGLLIKFLNNSRENREKIEQLVDIRKEMQADERTRHLVKAFPLAPVYKDPKGNEASWCGYVMHDCSADRDLGRCFLPETFDRELGLKDPTNAYRAMLVMCYNLCCCFAELHKKGLVVSDVKPDNFFVSASDLTVYPIDLDGFSVGGSTSQPPRDEYACGDTTVPSYRGTEASDAHGMALLLFQLMTAVANERYMRKVRDYALKGAGEEYGYFITNSLDKIRNVPKRRFYPAWYILPQEIREIFLERLFEPEKPIPGCLEWIILLYTFARQEYLTDVSYPPEKMIPEALNTPLDLRPYKIPKRMTSPLAKK